MQGAGGGRSMIGLISRHSVYNGHMEPRNAIMAISAAVILSACRTPVKQKELSLWVVPDLHYLSTQLYREDSASFQKLLGSNDGKMIEQMPEVLEDLKAQALSSRPDLILVPGDLTLNGEYESLLELKSLFHGLKEEGIEVIVIPGNHDINYPMAYDLNGDVVFGIRNISQADFTDLMKEFGYENSRSHAEDSFSYTYEAAEDLWILALDTNTEAAPGYLTDQTMAWAEAQLQYAQEHDIKVISMTHQNVLKQSEFLYQGFIINNAESAEQLLKQHGVRLNLSGHSHLQHTAVSESLTDICTESSAVWPLSYGVVSISADHTDLAYAKQLFNVDQTAAEQRLDLAINRQIIPTLQELGLSEETISAMHAFAAQLNKAYYTGQITDSEEYRRSEAWALWKQYGTETRWYPYFERILEEYSK